MPVTSRLGPTLTAAGAESAPAEIDTIADLPKLAVALAARGFSEPDVTAVMAGNC